MHSNSKETIKMKVFPKGQVVIPVSLRKKYHIEIGDQLEVISGPEGILLKPAAKNKNNASLTDRLFGIFSEYASRDKKLSKDDITRATEAGFIEGWTE
jgi:AbrB family looped-hinge helix DNA binding protein